MSSVVVLTGDDDSRKKMNQDISKYNGDIDKQEKKLKSKLDYMYKTRNKIETKYKELEILRRIGIEKIQIRRISHARALASHASHAGLFARRAGQADASGPGKGA